MRKFQACIPLLLSLLILSSGKVKSVDDASSLHSHVKPASSHAHHHNERSAKPVAAYTGSLAYRELSTPPPEQNEWRRCKNCIAIFYNGFRTKGICPSGRGHVSDQVKNYVLTYDSPGPGQRDWRYCHRCQVLFFDGFANKGVCKAGGGHVAAGFNFTLRHNSRFPGEKNWRFCNKCEALFFDGTRVKGVCAAGGVHTPAGYTFTLVSGQRID